MNMILSRTDRSMVGNIVENLKYKKKNNLKISAVNSQFSESDG